MQTVSSYGVELRKQNIPVRQTLEIYRSVVSYLTEIYEQVSVSSYETWMDLWEKSGEKAGKPRLAYENHAMPVFYRDVMYREEKEGKDEAYLKLYDGHDWKWFCVRLNHTDME